MSYKKNENHLKGKLMKKWRRGEGRGDWFWFRHVRRSLYKKKNINVAKFDEIKCSEH